MTPAQVELILEIIDLKVELGTLMDGHYREGITHQIECREQDLRDSAEEDDGK